MLKSLTKPVSARSLIRQISERSGVLVEQAIGKYGFAHRALHDYLTACHIAEQNMDALLVAQYPAGNTVHRVQARVSGSDAYQTVHEFSGSTNDNDWLIFIPDTPLENVTQIRIQTIASPSWVAWKEIQVFGEPMQP